LYQALTQVDTLGPSKKYPGSQENVHLAPSSCPSEEQLIDPKAGAVKSAGHTISDVCVTAPCSDTVDEGPSGSSTNTLVTCPFNPVSETSGFVLSGSDGCVPVAGLFATISRNLRIAIRVRIGEILTQTGVVMS